MSGKKTLNIQVLPLQCFLAWFLSEKTPRALIWRLIHAWLFFPWSEKWKRLLARISLEFRTEGVCVCIGAKNKIRIGRLWCVNFRSYRDSEREWILLIKPRHLRQFAPKLQPCLVKGTFSWVSLMSHSIYKCNKCCDLFPSPPIPRKTTEEFLALPLITVLSFCSR